MLFNLKYFKEIYIALGLLLGVILLGSIGYVLVEDYTFSQAFYMTVITISTVGFGEIFGEMTSYGRVFTCFLIIISFGIFAYAATSITRYLVTGQYRDYFRDYKVNQDIKKLQDHVIVCGYGRNGKQAIKTLDAHKMPYIVMEDREHIIEELRRDPTNIPYILGDATLEENIISAGVMRAKALITTLPKDSDNLFVVLTARELNKSLTIISRASQDNSDKKLRIAGANNVIMPDKVGGAQMASLVVTPDVVEFIDHLFVQGPGQINLEEISFGNIPSEMHYKTFRELESKYKTGASLVGCKLPDGAIIVNPTKDLELVPDSKLFVLGTTEQIHRLNQILLGLN